MYTHRDIKVSRYVRNGVFEVQLYDGLKAVGLSIAEALDKCAEKAQVRACRNGRLVSVAAALAQARPLKRRTA